MLDIEIIKWGCERADGFRFRYGENHDNLFWFEDVNCGMFTTVYEKVFYPLFLQRVIEGINRSNTEWQPISQCGYSIQVLTDCNRDFVLNIDLISTNDKDIDQAKEQAINIYTRRQNEINI